VIFVVLQEQGKQSGDEDDVRNIPIFLSVEEANCYHCIVLFSLVRKKYENRLLFVLLCDCFITGLNADK